MRRKTMKLICKKAIFLLAFLAAINQVHSQTYERKRSEKKAFAIKATTEIQINNKYGNIHIVNWEKDSVRFEIDLTLVGTKESKIQKNFEMIDFEFTTTGSYVIAKTVFKEGMDSFWGEVNDLATTIFNSTNRTQINYKVYMPANCPLKIENKFGNIYLDDHIGKVNITLANGDLKANEFTADFTLKIDFGKVIIRKLNKARISGSYAGIDIVNAGTINFDTRSSTLELSQVESLDMISRRDKINIEDIKSIKGDMSFTELRCENISGQIILTTSYGGLVFKSVSTSFDKIVLKSKFTDLSLNYKQEPAFNLSIEHSGKPEITLPTRFKKTSEEVIDVKQGVTKLTGNMGAGKTLPLINIQITGGRLEITNY